MTSEPSLPIASMVDPQAASELCAQSTDAQLAAYLSGLGICPGEERAAGTYVQMRWVLSLRTALGAAFPAPVSCVK